MRNPYLANILYDYLFKKYYTVFGFCHDPVKFSNCNCKGVESIFVVGLTGFALINQPNQSQLPPKYELNINNSFASIPVD